MSLPSASQPAGTRHCAATTAWRSPRPLAPRPGTSISQRSRRATCRRWRPTWHPGPPEGPLSRFQHCSVHGPAKHLPEGERAWKELVARLSGLPQAFAGRIVLHPDTLPSCAFEELRDLGSRLVLENMDCRKSSCRTVAELAPIFEELPEARFCFDVAHAWSVDRSLTEGQWLLDAFGERLCQVHCSGIGADGKHRPTEPRDLELYSELLAQCRDLPWVLESPWSSPGGVTAPPGQSSS